MDSTVDAPRMLTAGEFLLRKRILLEQSTYLSWIWKGFPSNTIQFYFYFKLLQDKIALEMAQQDELDCARDENIFINEADGLTNDHPSLPEYELDENALDNDSFDDLPTSIIVTNIHSEVFVDEDLKQEMEDLFRQFSEKVTFQWLKSFRRVRVNFTDPISAANARIQLHQFKINKSQINCYFAQPCTPVSNKNLQLPKPHKQFLISPPSSPPCGI